MSDVLDILELSRGNASEVSKASILGLNKPNYAALNKKKEMKRPEGMHRELFALLYSSDSNKELPPLLQTDSVAQSGYKSTKARLGMRRARPWAWLAFVNPGRSDGAMLSHWRRVADGDKEYPFAQFNKKVEVLQYTDAEYRQHLTSDSWSRAHTDTLMALCEQYDLRWPVVQDRWPYTIPVPEPVGDTKAGVTTTSRKPMIEDLKERYYQVTNALKKARSLTGPEGKLVHYDSEHERRRKLQLSRLWERTPEQVEEERSLLAEMRRIEARKRERDRKTQDLQKLISGAEGAEGECPPSAHKRPPKNTPRPKKQLPKAPSLTSLSTSSVLSEGVKFPELRSTGVGLRSGVLKVPMTLGMKRVKALEQLLTELRIDHHPMPTQRITGGFNSLRSDMVALYELKAILNNFVFELQTTKHQNESERPGELMVLPPELLAGETSGGLSEVLDSVTQPNTPNRKRKASVEQSNLLKKVKARNP